MTRSVHVSPCECVSVNLRVRLFMCAHVSECSKVRVCANVRVCVCVCTYYCMFANSHLILISI